MPAMLAVRASSSLLNAAAGCCKRLPQRSKHATPAAANRADRSAIERIWRAEMLYMALLSDDFINFFDTCVRE